MPGTTVPALPRLLPLGLCLASAGAFAHTSDASVPGSASAPSPTPYGIGVVWPCSGDADGDGRVGVRYRPAGGAWQQGMPLFRVPAGATSDGVSWSARHAGSLFDLEPATTYEIELTLVDPDGGGTLTTLSVATRALPAPMAGAPVKAATPATFASVVAGIQPGDILELAAGTYPAFTWGSDGQTGKPIVIRSSAGAVIDGNIDLFGRSHVHFDGLTIAGRLRFNGGLDIAVQHCVVHARADRGNGDAIVSYTRSEDCFIADNTVVGTTVWAESSLGVSGSNLGDGIEISGPGTVIRNNRVRGFRDGIALMEGNLAADQYSVDIIGNDISECADDGIQADSAMHNVRVVRNRLTNCFMGISSQPGYGGPLYLVRNALYNIVFESFKLHNGTVGDVLLNNTVVKSGDAIGIFSGAVIARTFARNNLLIGGPGQTWNGYNGGNGRVIDAVDLEVASVSLDYDGYGANDGTFAGKFGAVAFNGLAQLRSLTSEAHATQVGLSVFAATIAYPAAAMTTFAAPDLRLAAGSAAVDAGVVIPGITDGFAGTAPDLGAYEIGRALPIYGPRSPGNADLAPPVISALVVDAFTASSGSVHWTTDEAADAQVEYGATASYGSTTSLQPTLATSHVVALAGLAPGTTYHARVRTRDAAGNLALSGDVTFTTTAAGSPPPPTPPATSDGGGGSCGLGGVAAALSMLMLAGLRRR